MSTKDHVLVARHENEISQTTDVEDHPEFAGRADHQDDRRRRVTGWFTEDFTLAELKTLRATERIPEVRQQNTIYDGRFEIPTLQEVLDLAARESRRPGRAIGIAPETKHPTYFDALGLSLEEPLVAALHRAGLTGRSAPVFVQSFETANLRELDGMTRLPLVQLSAAAARPTTWRPPGPADLRGPADRRRASPRSPRTPTDRPGQEPVVRARDDGTLLAPTVGRSRAHVAGLLVVPYTFRNENTFLPANFRRGTPRAGYDAYGDAFAEYELFFDPAWTGCSPTTRTSRWTPGTTCSPRPRRADRPASAAATRSRGAALRLAAARP